MEIRTTTGLSGWVASDPQLSHTLERARLYFRFGQAPRRRGDNAGMPGFGDLIVFGKAAEAAFRDLRSGDRFTAEGRVTVDEQGQVRFIANSIGVNGNNPHIRVLHRPTAARGLTDAQGPSAGMDPVSR